jgi:hypothetical protein
MEVELQFVYTGDGPLLVPVRPADLELQRSTVGLLLETARELCERLYPGLLAA